MWRDDAYLLDMLLFAGKAQSMNSDVSLASFLADEKLQLATLHVLQTGGETAGKVSPEFHKLPPEIAWKRIIGLRHRLVHDYPRIELPKVWQIVKDHIPALITNLGPLVPPDTP